MECVIDIEIGSFLVLFFVTYPFIAALFLEIAREIRRLSEAIERACRRDEGG